MTSICLKVKLRASIFYTRALLFFAVAVDFLLSSWHKNLIAGGEYRTLVLLVIQ